MEHKHAVPLLSDVAEGAAGGGGDGVGEIVQYVAFVEANPYYPPPQLNTRTTHSSEKAEVSFNQRFQKPRSMIPLLHLHARYLAHLDCLVINRVEPATFSRASSFLRWCLLGSSPPPL